MEILIWALALLFTVGMFVAVWLKIGQDDYYPIGYFASALWFVPILYVFYESAISPYHLVWLMPLTALLAGVVDTMILLGQLPGRSRRSIHGIVVFLVTGLVVFPILIFL